MTIDEDNNNADDDDSNGGGDGGCPRVFVRQFAIFVRLHGYSCHVVCCGLCLS